MFEVIIKKTDGSIETWDCLNALQAECVFFRARMKEDTHYVELNEVYDPDSLTA